MEPLTPDSATRPASHDALFPDGLQESLGKDLAFAGIWDRVPPDLRLLVDSAEGKMQGQRADLVLVTTVRANSDEEMGFLNETERWKIIMSRPGCHIVYFTNISRGPTLPAGSFLDFFGLPGGRI